MKRLVLFVALALNVATAAIAPAQAEVTSSDQAQIHALYRKFITAFRHKDLNAIMSVYVHDDSLFVFDVTPPREHIGWNGYRADWKDFFGIFKGPVSFDVSDLQVATSGDVAYSP